MTRVHGVQGVPLGYGGVPSHLVVYIGDNPADEKTEVGEDA